MERKIVKELICTLDDYEMFHNKSLVDIIVKLENLNFYKQKQYSNYSNLKIILESYGYDFGYSFCLYGERLETDKEYEVRLSQELKKNLKLKKEQEKKEKEEKLLLKKLLKKYPNTK